MPEEQELLAQAVHTLELDLSTRQLVAPPSSIWAAAGLTSLNLSCNCLETLPSEIGQLRGLAYLDTSFNKLHALPQQLSQLSRLTCLDAAYNQLAALCDGVCSLPLLQLLSLHDNQITHLPEAVATLPSLITLDLQFNPLRQLPDSLMAVRDLVELKVEGCPLAPRTLALLQSGLPPRRPPTSPPQQPPPAGSSPLQPGLPPPPSQPASSASQAPTTAMQAKAAAPTLLQPRHPPSPLQVDVLQLPPRPPDRKSQLAEGGRGGQGGGGAPMGEQEGMPAGLADAVYLAQEEADALAELCIQGVCTPRSPGPQPPNHLNHLGQPTDMAALVDEAAAGEAAAAVAKAGTPSHPSHPPLASCPASQSSQAGTQTRCSPANLAPDPSSSPPSIAQSMDQVVEELQALPPACAAVMYRSLCMAQEGVAEVQQGRPLSRGGTAGIGRSSSSNGYPGLLATAGPTRQVHSAAPGARLGSAPGIRLGARLGTASGPGSTRPGTGVAGSTGTRAGGGPGGCWAAEGNMRPGTAVPGSVTWPHTVGSRATLGSPLLLGKGQSARSQPMDNSSGAGSSQGLANGHASHSCVAGSGGMVQGGEGGFMAGGSAWSRLTAARSRPASSQDGGRDGQRHELDCNGDPGNCGSSQQEEPAAAMQNVLTGGWQGLPPVTFPFTAGVRAMMRKMSGGAATRIGVASVDVDAGETAAWGPGVQDSCNAVSDAAEEDLSLVRQLLAARNPELLATLDSYT